MSLKLFCTLTFFLAAFFLTAHQGSIKGAVYNSATNAPLPGATVVLLSTDKGTATDEFGIFKFNDLPEGNYEVQISFIGYSSQKQNAKVSNNESSTLKFYLKEAQVSLNVVNISSADKLDVNSIQALDIKLRPINNSQDVLRIVPGLFIAQHAGGGKAEQIFLRGFDIDHGTDINLTVDGMPINMVSHAHGQGYSDLHFIIPETIDRVQFDKGPYEADKGDFTTAGYAAFATRNFLDRDLVKLEAGDFNTIRGVGMFKVLSKNKQQAYIASEINLTDGYFESNQNFHRLNILGKYTGYINNDNQVQLQASVFNSRWDASGQIPQRAIRSGQIGRFGAIDDTEGGATQRINLSAATIRRMESGDILKNQVYFTKYDFELYSNFTFFLEDTVNGDQIRQRESRNLYGYNGSYNFQRKINNIKTRTEVGLQLRFDLIEDVELSHTKNRLQTLEYLALGDIQQLNGGIYIDERIEISNRLRLTLGTRVDYFDFQYENTLDTAYNLKSETKTLVSPKAALFYDMRDNLELFIKAGMGFHSNDARVVVAQQGKSILPRAYGADLGANIKVGSKVILKTALWILDLEQEFVYVGDAGIVEPGGYSRRAGLDVSIRAQLYSFLYADADLNYTHGRSLDAEQGENRIPLAPIFTSTGGLSCRFPKGWNGSIRYRYLADRPVNEDYSLTADGYFLMDAMISYNTPKFEIGLGLENVLDQEWREAQFETESRLAGEQNSVSEIHFTPGSPRYIKGHISFFL